MENSNTFDSCWKYFNKNEANKATCSLCQKEFPMDSEFTSNLDDHLIAVHGLTRNFLPKEPAPSRISDNSRDNQMQVRRLSLQELLVTLIYNQKLSLNDIISSANVSQIFSEHGHPCPRNLEHLTTMVNNVYYEAKAEVQFQIKELVERNQKFNLFVEEWALQHKTLYLILRVFYSPIDSFNLGLLVFKSNDSSQFLLRLIKRRLVDFGLSLKRDIICFMCEGFDLGSNVVGLVGDLSPAFEQNCYNRGLQKALLGALFSKKPFEDHEFKEDEEDEATNCSCDPITNFFIRASVVETLPIAEIETVMSSIRYMITHLQLPLHKNMYDKVVSVCQKVNLPIFLACPDDLVGITRMMRNFFAMESQVKYTLIFFHLDHLWDNTTMQLGKNVLQVLEAFILVMACLNEDHTNLITADLILKMFFSHLNKIQDVVPPKLLPDIQKQLSLRRNKTLVSLIKFLHNRHHKEEPGFFEMSSESAMFQAAFYLYNRLFRSNPGSKKVNPENHKRKLNFKGELKEFGESSTKDSGQVLDEEETRVQDNFSRKSVEADALSPESLPLTYTEFEEYKRTGIRGPKLDAVYTALLTIKPAFMRIDVITATVPKIYYRRHTKFSSSIIDKMNVMKNAKINQ